jgi:hypothetical protein
VLVEGARARRAPAMQPDEGKIAVANTRHDRAGGKSGRREVRSSRCAPPSWSQPNGPPASAPKQAADLVGDRIDHRRGGFRGGPAEPDHARPCGLPPQRARHVSQGDGPQSITPNRHHSPASQAGARAAGRLPLSYESVDCGKAPPGGADPHTRDIRLMGGCGHEEGRPEEEPDGTSGRPAWPGRGAGAVSRYLPQSRLHRQGSASRCVRLRPRVAAGSSGSCGAGASGHGALPVGSATIFPSRPRSRERHADYAGDARTGPTSPLPRDGLASGAAGQGPASAGPSR